MAPTVDSGSPWSCDLLGEGPVVFPLLCASWHLLAGSRHLCRLVWWRMPASVLQWTSVPIMALGQLIAVGTRQAPLQPPPQCLHPKPNSSDKTTGSYTVLSTSGSKCLSNVRINKSATCSG